MAIVTPEINHVNEWKKANFRLFLESDEKLCGIFRRFSTFDVFEIVTPEISNKKPA